LVWKIEGILAKCLKMTFAYRFTGYLFFHIRSSS
jgi:hypothetical protein